MLLLLCWPRAHAAFLFGNTDMWAMAGVAAGLLWGWPAFLLLLKPTFAPLAIIGIGSRRRTGWFALVILAAASLAMLPLWLDYVMVIRNVRIGLDYALASVPLVVIPIVAWYARRGRSRSAGGTARIAAGPL